MKRSLRLGFILTISLVFATGCWDRTELNDIALLLGWGMDYKDGRYIGTAQIVIPGAAQSGQQGGGGGNNNAYFTETAIGKDITDTTQNLQSKLSRQIFAGHRKDVFIGEELAKHGLSKMLDEYSRNPDVRLRTDIFVVKGGTAEDILKIPNPLEKVPALAALKLHQQIGGLGDVTLANFLIDASTEGSSPSLPVMEIVTSSRQQDQEQGSSTNSTSFAYAGRAVFNMDEKLAGYLDRGEAELAWWVKGLLKFYRVTGVIPQRNGTVSLNLSKLGAHIQPSLQGNKIKFVVTLTGEGTIPENNTSLDLSQTKNLNLIQNAFDKQCQQQVQQVISKVQQEYKADILGFGEAFHRKYPEQWKSLKKNWGEEFPKSDVTVKVNLKIKRVGLTGPSLGLKESQIKE
ncbi:Ger(x)C family spore germination protein [Alicyclobacillus fastidiosus]|uniref:Ger(X)C family spore germination protein n=1 Tax=Alicyclobacillus fastidiosus TaxID=392011 RepID=A0ABV5AJD1_9BACL|nr:Ger(x)C family spore germination protein [Alicyclobacillus fastidiosus]WEH08369.1 Ger(x)C family spore germination protein [Alicyclobacillus fastidiosus]